MQINKEMLQALQRAVEEAGGAIELSRRSGVNAANISRYLNGKVHAINDLNWSKLAPFLGVYHYQGFSPSPHIEVREYAVPYLGRTSPITQFGHNCQTVRNTAELREFIKDAMLRNGVSDAAALCRCIGYHSPDSISRLLAGELSWFPDVLAAVFDALDLDPQNAPVSGAEREILPPRGIYRDGAMLVRPIPLVDWANAASHLESISGDGVCVTRNWDPAVTETVPAPVSGCRDLKAFRAAGLSMEPRIQDGDIIFVEPVRNISDIPNRKIVIAKFKDSGRFPESVVCKRFHLRENPSSILLTSDNPEGKIISCHPDDISWIGIVVRKISDL